MTLSIIDKMNEWVEPFKNWIMANHGNPIMWLGFVLIGIAVFSITFGALHRNGD